MDKLTPSSPRSSRSLESEPSRIINKFGRWVVSRLDKTSDFYQTETKAYKGQINQWIDDNFKELDETAKKRIKESKEVQDLTEKFNYFSKRRVIAINKNVALINDELKLSGYNNEFVKNHVFDSIDEDILSGKKDLSNDEIQNKIKKTISDSVELYKEKTKANNESVINITFKTYGFENTDFKSELEEKYKDVLNGNREINSNDLKDIYSQIIKPRIIEDMNDLSKRAAFKVSFDQFLAEADNEGKSLKALKNDFIEKINESLTDSLTHDIETIEQEYVPDEETKATFKQWKEAIIDSSKPIQSKFNIQYNLQAKKNQLSQNKGSISKLKAELNETETAYNKVLKKYSKLPQQTGIPFTEMASGALGRDYGNPQTLSRSEINKIKGHLKAEIEAYQKAIAEYEKKNPSDLRDTATEFVEQKTEEAAEVVQEGWKKTTEVVSEAATVVSDAAATLGSTFFNIFGSSDVLRDNIPINENLKKQYNKYLKQASDNGIKEVIQQNGQRITLKSIEEEWRTSSERYNKRNVSKEEQQKRFTSRIQSITTLMKQTLIEKQKQQANERLSTTAAPEKPQPLSLRPETKQTYDNLIQSKTGFPKFETLWKTMDQFYTDTIYDRNERRTKLNNNLNLFQFLIDANTSAYSAAGYVQWGQDMLFGTKAPTLSVELQKEFEQTLQTAKAAGVQETADLKTIWDYYNKIFMDDPAFQKMNETERQKNFEEKMVKPLITWMKDMTAMQPLLKA